MRNTIFVLILFLISFNFVNAQISKNAREKKKFKEKIIIKPTYYPIENQTTAYVEGILIDSLSSEPLISAAVKILGTDKGILTNENGYFKLEVSADTLSLIFSMPGYQSKQINSIKIEKGKSLHFNITLSDQKMLEEIIIVSTLDKETEAAANMLKLNSIKLIDIFSGELVKQSSIDLPLVSTINRMPGVVTTEDKDLVVRGLSSRFLQYTINGIPWKGYTMDQNNIDLSVLPTQALSSIQLYKSATSADVPNFSGANIDLVLQSIPTQNELKITSQYQYQTLKGFNPSLVFPKMGKFDIESFPNVNDMVFGSEEHIQTTKDFPFRKGFFESKPAYLNGRIMAKWQYLKKIDDKKEFGLTSFLDLAQNASLERRKITVPFGYDTTLQKSIVNDVGDYKFHYLNKTINGFINFGYKAEKWSIHSYNFLSQKNSSKILDNDGLSAVDEFANESIQYFYYASNLVIEKNIHNQIHFIYNPNNRLKFNLKLFNNYNPLNQPYHFAITYYDNGNGANQYDPEDQDSAYSFGTTLDQKNSSRGFTSELDYVFSEIGLTSKLGIYANFQKNQFRARRIGFYNDVNYSYDSTSLLVQNQTGLYGDSNIGAGKFLLVEMEQAHGKQLNHDQNIAPYLQLDWSRNEKLFVNLGLRMDFYQSDFNFQKAEADNYQTKELHPLFSAAIRYKAFDKQNFRFSVFQSLSRANFKERTPFNYFDMLYSIDYRGNKDLVTTQIWNADLRWEFIPSPRQLFSATVLYKQFKNPIEQYLSESLIGVISPYSLRNIPNGSLIGFELEARISPEPIAKNWMFYLNGSSFWSANASNITAKNTRPLQGQTNFIVNVGALYKSPKTKIESALFFNTIGQQLILVGLGPLEYPDIYQLPRMTLDFQVSKKFGKFHEIRCTLTDILQRNYRRAQYYDGNTKFIPSRSLMLYQGNIGSRIIFSYTFKI